MDSDEQVSEEIWLYAGIFVDADRKRSHLWIPEVLCPDVTKRFAAHRESALAVGGEYTVKVSRPEPGVTFLHGQPSYVGVHRDEELRARLQAQHRARDTKYRRKQLEASDKRKSAIDDASGPLLEIAKHMPGPDRDAFAVYVLRKIMQAY